MCYIKLNFVVYQVDLIINVLFVIVAFILQNKSRFNKSPRRKLSSKL